MKKVAVLCGGGSSSEREVSLRSGRAVFEALKSHMDAMLFELSEDELPLDLDPEQFVVFPMLHGEFGEDGQLQALLEARNFQYCGSNAISSRLCMDKARTKNMVQRLEILMPRSCFYKGQPFTKLWEEMGGPFVIKPNNRGSSIGVTKVYTEADFENCKDLHQGTWLVEKCIEGREITVGILKGKALPVIEIHPKDEFYDYRHKYTSGMTDYFVPAPISPTETYFIQGISEKIFEMCGCRDLGRLDFILDPHGEFYFLEINTIPGMTQTSLVPKAAAAAGISMTDLCLKILER